MEYVDYAVDQGVASITLNRPDVLNSFTIPMGKEVQSCLEQARDDQQIRAIYLTGTGRAFCAGQDLEEATREGGPSIDHIVEETYEPIIHLIRSIEKPVICGVNGTAAGAGANLALTCDITFAKTSASFIQAFSSIGLIPDSAGTYFLPRLVGQQRAAAYMFSAEKVKAREAERIGMIYKALDEEEWSEALAFAQRLARRPTVGIGLTKRLLNHSIQASLEEQLAMEKELQAEAAKSEDHKEGVTAFLEKRKPQFTGR